MDPAREGAQRLLGNVEELADELPCLGRGEGIEADPANEPVGGQGSQGLDQPGFLVHELFGKGPDEANGPILGVSDGEMEELQ